MTRFKIQTFALAVIFSFTLATAVAVPEADAGVWAFLKRHFHHHHKDIDDTRSQVDQGTPHGTSTNTDQREVPADQNVEGTPRGRSTSSAQRAVPADQKVEAAKRSTASRGHKFTTNASWYGAKFHGRRTASGARFDEHSLTAASRTLPLGSKLRVSNPKTGKSCTVTINDRGPFVKGRGIDLSRGAAAKM
jgi:rare lipoprotein A